jgi:hypothetical protein
LWWYNITYWRRNYLQKTIVECVLLMFLIFCVVFSVVLFRWMICYIQVTAKLTIE